MKVVLPWPLEDQQSCPLPAQVEQIVWLEGDPPAEALDAEFVFAPYSAGKPGRLASFTDLKVVQSQSAGVDWVLRQVPDGVLLCDASGVHDRSTSEWVLTALLASIRELPRFVRQQDAHQWQPKETVELAGRRVLIVGYGSIGAAIEPGLQQHLGRAQPGGTRSSPSLSPEANHDPALVPLARLGDFPGVGDRDSVACRHAGLP